MSAPPLGRILGTFTSKDPSEGGKIGEAEGWKMVTKKGRSKEPVFTTDEYRFKISAHFTL